MTDLIKNRLNKNFKKQMHYLTLVFNDFFIFATFVLYQYQITMVNHQFTSPEITYINSNYFNGKNLDKFLHSTYGQQKSTAMLAGTLEEP